MFAGVDSDWDADVLSGVGLDLSTFLLFLGDFLFSLLLSKNKVGLGD